jgi:hypothetical protein
MGKRFVSVLLASAFVAACGGGASTTTTASAGASAAATSAATTAPSAAASSAPSAASGPKLADLLLAGKNAQYKISYKLTATGSASSFSGTQSWYFKPPKSRFDFSFAAAPGAPAQSMSIFSIPDGQFMCFTQGGPATCLSLPATGSPMDANLAASFQGSLVDHPDQFGGTFTGTKTIAGVQGSCYDVKATAAAATGLSSGSFCYSKEGIPLLSQFSVQGNSWSMEATNVSTTVPDSDFVLPAKPSVYGYP